MQHEKTGVSFLNNLRKISLRGSLQKIYFSFKETLEKRWTFLFRSALVFNSITQESTLC